MGGGGCMFGFHEIMAVPIDSYLVRANALLVCMKKGKERRRFYNWPGK